jgi:hypothetical protein
VDEYIENDKKELKKALELLGEGEEKDTIYLPESAKKVKEKYTSYLGGIKNLTIALEKSLEGSIDSRIDALYALAENIISNMENQMEYEEKILALEAKNKDLEERLEGLEAIVKKGNYLPQKKEEPKSEELPKYPNKLTHPPHLKPPENKRVQSQVVVQNSELAKLKEELLENLINLKKVMNKK